MIQYINNKDGIYNENLATNEVATHLNGEWVDDVIRILKKYGISKGYVLDTVKDGYPGLGEHAKACNYYKELREWLLERKLLVHHVCRVFPSSTYKTDGLKPATEELLIGLAKDLVPDIENYIPKGEWPSLMLNHNMVEVSMCIKDTLSESGPSTQYIYGPESFYKVERYLEEKGYSDVSALFHAQRNKHVGTPAIIYGWIEKDTYKDCRDYIRPEFVPNPEPRDEILKILTVNAVKHNDGENDIKDQYTLRLGSIPCKNIVAIILPEEIKDHYGRTVKQCSLV